MKTKNYSLKLMIILWLITFPVSSTWGFGPTVIVGDMTDLFKWPRELAQWTLLIEQAKTYVDRADEMIQLAGDPKKVAAEITAIVGSVGSLTNPLNEALKIDELDKACDLAKNVYDLGNTVRHAILDANQVGKNYKCFGKEFTRDSQRFTQYMIHEGLNARHEKAVSNASKVEKAELKVQKRLLTKLKKKDISQAERDTINTMMDASRQRVAMAQMKASQCRDEYDLFAGRLRNELERKEAADKEWADQMLKEMRHRACEVMKAQNGGNTPTDSDDVGDGD